MHCRLLFIMYYKTDHGIKNQRRKRLFILIWFHAIGFVLLISEISGFLDFTSLGFIEILLVIQQFLLLLLKCVASCPGVW